MFLLRRQNQIRTNTPSTTTIRNDYEESSVSISCQYESEDQNLKYVCRGNQTSTCLEKAILTSDNKQTGQFRLTDDKVSKRFTVTITGLTQNHAGSYLCGVHGNTGLDVFSAFELEVKGESSSSSYCSKPFVFTVIRQKTVYCKRDIEER
uniref:Immunoglobulin V-set domain-containing protein n=1 Tax=Cyclopterus lumpus TaxID=8103 RepID=A0A8C2XN06_CYCLU